MPVAMLGAALHHRVRRAMNDYLNNGSDIYEEAFRIIRA